MTDIAIQVENLSRRYRIGRKEDTHETLSGAVVDLLTRPVKNFRRLRQLSRFSENGHNVEDIIWALKDISFQVKRGEVVGIIGRNGAGKSTLLKILSRITAPTGGYARINGRVGSLLEVGTGFHQELTGRENVYLNGTVLGMTRKDVQHKFDEIVDFSGVEKFIDTPVKRYSSGMKVRLAFAVAAHLDPEILLVDEVLSVGDAEFQRKCLGKMEDVAGKGRTVLFVSHNMSAINRLCPRVILMDAGKLIKDGIPSEVTSTYLMGTDGAGVSRNWSLDQGPGTEELRLTSVSLVREDGIPVSVVDVTEPLELRIGYIVEKPNLRSRCAAMFYTQGVCAFAAVEPTESVKEHVGSYYSVVVIPPNLLTEGEYIVDVSIFDSRGSKRRYVQVRSVLAFQVYDLMTGSSARGDYAQDLIGVVRPRLAWRLSFVSH